MASLTSDLLRFELEKYDYKIETDKISMSMVCDFNNRKKLYKQQKTFEKYLYSKFEYYSD